MNPSANTAARTLKNWLAERGAAIAPRTHLHRWPLGRLSPRRIPSMSQSSSWRYRGEYSSRIEFGCSVHRR